MLFKWEAKMGLEEGSLSRALDELADKQQRVQPSNKQAECKLKQNRKRND